MSVMTCRRQPREQLANMDTTMLFFPVKIPPLLDASMSWRRNQTHPTDASYRWLKSARAQYTRETRGWRRDTHTHTHASLNLALKVSNREGDKHCIDKRTKREGKLFVEICLFQTTAESMEDEKKRKQTRRDETKKKKTNRFFSVLSNGEHDHRIQCRYLK